MFKDLRIDIDKKDKKGRTALYLAAKNNDFLRAEKLLSQGADVNAMANKNKTPLHKSAQKNIGDSHFRISELLLKNGADAKSQDSKRGGCNIPIWYLMERGNEKIVRLFLNFVYVDVVNIDGQTLLFPAAYHNNPDVVQLLIDLGVDVNHQDKSGATALEGAANNNKGGSHYKVAKILLEAGADANKSSRLPPLVWLVVNGNYDIIKLFVDFRANVKWVGRFQEYDSLLFRVALFNKESEVLQLFIDHGLSVNEGNERGETPLHSACTSDYDSIKKIKILLRNGADINIENEDRCTPLADALGTLDYRLKDIGAEAFEKRLNFIMEHSDFSIEWVKNTFNYRRYTSKYLWKIALRHLAKLKSLDIPVHQDLLKEISYRQNYKHYFERCEKELTLSKNTKLKSSWITFYNLLVGDRRKLKNYAGNDDLISDFKNSDYKKLFPIYGTSINENMKKGVNRRRLFDKSSIILSDFLPIFNPSHLIIRDIFNCILSKKDLSKFCE